MTLREYVDSLRNKTVAVLGVGVSNTPLVRLLLHTGRTHQIRVHMAYLGHPVAGDPVYGSGKPAWLEGQCLHAKKIGFVHPRTGKYMEFDSELPEYFKKYLKSIEG